MSREIISPQPLQRASLGFTAGAAGGEATAEAAEGVGGAVLSVTMYLKDEVKKLISETMKTNYKIPNNTQ